MSKKPIYNPKPRRLTVQERREEAEVWGYKIGEVCTVAKETKPIPWNVRLAMRWLGWWERVRRGKQR